MTTLGMGARTQVQGAVERAMEAGVVPRAKRMICLFLSGGPSQQDLFDYNPKLREMHGEELPASVIGGQQLTGMT